MKTQMSYPGGFAVGRWLIIITIGILITLAFSQHKRKGVVSQMMRYQSVAKEITAAQEEYYAAHGKYAADLQKLNVNLEGCTLVTDYVFKGNQYSCGTNIFLDNAVVTNADPNAVPRGTILVEYCRNANKNYDTCRVKRDAIIATYFKHASSEYKGKKVCWHYTLFGESLCKSLRDQVDFFGIHD